MRMTFKVLVDVKFILEPLPRKQIGENVQAGPEYNLVNTPDFATESPVGNHTRGAYNESALAVASVVEM